VITVFLPGMVERVTGDDHPHLTFDGLVPNVTVAHDRWRDLALVRAFHEAVIYRDEETLELVQTIFRETTRLAEARGAQSLFVTPCLGNGWPRGDGYLVDALLRKQGLAVVDPDFHFEGIPGDNHPNAASTRRLAEAVVAALRIQLAER
jgi:hypothetical protein